MTEEEKLFAEVRSGMIEALLSKKMGKLAAWEKPTLVHSIGPTNVEAFNEFEAKRDQLSESVRAKLNSMSNRDIVHVAGQGEEFEDVSADEWQGFLQKEIWALIRAMPDALLLGLGHPSLAADMPYWGQMAHYSLHEALMLSVGIEPTLINSESLDEILRRENRIPALTYLEKRRELFRRGFRRSHWDFYPAEPAWLLDWFGKIALDVAPSFKAELTKRSKSQEPEREVPEDASVSLTSQERKSLLTLIAAMACEQYNYNPSAKRSAAVSDVQSDVEQIGGAMDAKTVRKWLKEAAILVDSSYWDDDA